MKCLKRIWNIFSTTVLAFITFVAISLIVLRIGGFSPYFVLSPSMSPTYKVGDLVYAKHCDYADIEIGDVIVFNNNKVNFPVMHRVVEIDNNEKCFYTKGDANDNRDSGFVKYKSIKGVVEFSIPKIGFVFMYFTTLTGKIVGVCIVVLIILVLLLFEILKKYKRMGCEENEKR